MSVSVASYTTKTITFSVFGKDFNYEVPGSENTMGIKLDEIVPLLSRELVEAQWEYSRSDKKKVILFYRSGPQSGFISFKFAVEADATLEEWMKEDDHKAKIAKMISYMFKNKEQLNFLV